MGKDDKLSAAVKLVNEAIAAETEKLKAIASGNDQDPVLVEGETETGYYCQMIVDPKEVARVYLRHDYPTWRVLEEDAPDAMWDELASTFRLKSVSSADL